MFSCGKAGKANLILLFCDQQPSFQKRTEKSEIFKQWELQKINYKNQGSEYFLDKSEI